MAYIYIYIYIYQNYLTYMCIGHVQSGTVCSTFNFVLLVCHISVGCSGYSLTFCTVRVTRRTAVCVYLLKEERLYITAYILSDRVALSVNMKEQNDYLFMITPCSIENTLDTDRSANCKVFMC